MATIYSDGFQFQPALDSGLQHDVSPSFQFTLVDITIAQDDILVCCPVPKGFNLLEWWLDIPTGVTSAVFELGYGTIYPNTTNEPDASVDTVADPTFFAATLTAGTTPISSTQAGVPAVGSLPYLFVGDSTIILQSTTGSSAITGPILIKGWVRGNMLYTPGVTPVF